MKTRLALVGLLVFFLGALVWLSIPSTKISAQTASQAVCVENCNDQYKVCHDRAVDALVTCLSNPANARDFCTDKYEAAQARCKAAHDRCIDGC